MKTTEILAAFFFNHLDRGLDFVADWYFEEWPDNSEEDFKNFIKEARKEMAKP